MIPLSPTDTLTRLKEQCGFQSDQLIVSIDAHRDEVFLMAMDEPLRVPVRFSLNYIHRLLNKRWLSKGHLELPPYIKVGDPANNAAALCNPNWQLITTLVSPPNATVILYSEERGRLVRARAIEVGCPAKKLYRLLLRYWRYGSAPEALTPAYSRCGGKGNRRLADQTKKKDAHDQPKRGRTPLLVSIGHAPEKIGVNVTSIDQEHIITALKLWHLNGERLNLEQTYQRMLERFYPNSDPNTAGDHLLEPLHTAPSEIQFRYWAKFELAKVQNQKARYGAIGYAKNHRGLPGRSRDGLFGPTAQYEIDSTIADVWLVSAYDRRRLIGKPVVYVVVDTYSALIVGLHVALIGPSWDTARLALFNAFTDPVAYCKKNGVQIDFDDWPCREVAYSVFADRAELFGSTAAASLSAIAPVTRKFAGVRRADAKGLVEGKFGTTNESLKWIAGAYVQRENEWRKDTGRDCRRDARLILTEFTGILIHEVLQVNNYTEKPHLLTKEMIADRVRPCSRDIYLWGLENLTGCARRMDPAHLYNALLPTAKATITEKGLVFDGMTYLSERMLREHWLARARKKRFYVQIHYDPNSPLVVWMRDASTGIWETCELAAFCREEYLTHRHEDVIDQRASANLQQRDREDQVRQERAKTNAKQQRIVANARAEFKASGSKHVSVEPGVGVRQNRRDEHARQYLENDPRPESDHLKEDDAE